MSVVTEKDHSSRSRRLRRTGPGGRPPDSQTVLVRRLAAIGAAVVILLIMVLGVRGCMDARKKTALKNYTRSVATLIQESDKQVGQPFFELLSQPTQQSAQDLQTSISGYRVQAETQLSQAKKFDVPKSMQSAQRSLLMVFQFRRDGLDAVAQRIRTALSDNADAAAEAIEQIAAEMQFFVASDVTYQARVVPQMKKALKDAGLRNQALGSSQFLAGIEWLSPETVALKLGQIGALKRHNRRNAPLAPGRHGTALVSLHSGETRVLPNAANRLPASTKSFTVAFRNTGDNEEFGIKASLSIEGGGKPIKLERTIDTVAKGATAQVTFQLNSAPPTGVPVTIRVHLDPVPGEQSVEGNKAEYQVLFSQ